jgi:hypothetical protein
MSVRFSILRSRTSASASCLLLALFALLSGCPSADPATEILVVVDSDLELGTELDALHVEVFDRAGRDQLVVQDFELGSDGSRLPMSFSLYPQGGAKSLRLVVTGRASSGGEAVDVIERQVTATFRPQQRVLLSIHLERSCLNELCRDDDGERTDLTCLSGSCEMTPAATLTPAGDGLLGGYEMDASSVRPREAGADAARPLAEAGAAADARTPDECTEDEECVSKLGEVQPRGCARARCVDGACVFEVADQDNDGDRQAACTASGVKLTPGQDCDDSDPNVSSLGWDGPAGMDGNTARRDQCDEVDNDCNGKVDDRTLAGASCACDPAKDVDVACSLLEDGSEVKWPTGAPTGRCRAGKRSCVDGAWTPCVGTVVPLEEDSCSSANDDSNCNGVQGENCQCTDGQKRACGTDVGSCETGEQTCSNGRWSSRCIGDVTAQASDSCDPMNDDNCNGSVNDGCKCINGTVSTCGQVLPTLGDCLDRPVTCTNGVWPNSVCEAQCNDCPATNPCEPGTCVDGRSSFTCDCPPGSTGDGTQKCVAVDDCPADDPCAPGSCVDGVNTFTCECPTEYEGNGTGACTPINTVCQPGIGGIDGGAGILCGPHTFCGGEADAGVTCECDDGYVPIPGSDPPACRSAS